MRRFSDVDLPKLMNRLRQPADGRQGRIVTRAVRNAQLRVEQQNKHVRMGVLKFDNDERTAQRHLCGAPAHPAGRISTGGPPHAGRGRHRLRRRRHRRCAACRLGSGPCGRHSPRSSGGDQTVVVDPRRRRPRSPQRNCSTRWSPTPNEHSPNGRPTSGRSRARAMRLRERDIIPGRHGPQVARTPLRDGLPQGGHRPAGDGPAGPVVEFRRRLRDVRRHARRAEGGVRRSPVPGLGRPPRKGVRAEAPDASN